MNYEHIAGLEFGGEDVKLDPSVAASEFLITYAGSMQGTRLRGPRSAPRVSSSLH